MLGNISNLGSMIKRMQDFGGKINEMNQICRNTKVQGNSGGGLVNVEVNGLCEVLNCKIDPVVFSQGDSEFLEDLIITAMNDAIEKSREKHSEIMRNVAGSMELPDMDSLKDMFEKISPE
ncbi:MAG: YbaB/EbfC family nucleoid-associated protein [Thermoguttaceae bacterium]